MEVRGWGPAVVLRTVRPKPGYLIRVQGGLYRALYATEPIGLRAHATPRAGAGAGAALLVLVLVHF